MATACESAAPSVLAEGAMEPVPACEAAKAPSVPDYLSCVLPHTTVLGSWPHEGQDLDVSSLPLRRDASLSLGKCGVAGLVSGGPQRFLPSICVLRCGWMHVDDGEDFDCGVPSHALD